jgi:hypothetical protein
MSSLGPQTDVRSGLRDVRVTPQSRPRLSAFGCPLRARKGRPAGSQNKYSADVKNKIWQTFVNLGAQDQLDKWAKKHQTLFYTVVLPKLITRTVEVQGDAPKVDATGAVDRLKAMVEAARVGMERQRSRTGVAPPALPAPVADKTNDQ